jgi:peroxiredoxin Q/BCP
MFDWLFSDPLPTGSPAPDFTLPKQDGGTVALSKLRGKNVVLVFYPGDDTPVCRKQLCEFRDQWSEARKRNTQVFGVNPASARQSREVSREIPLAVSAAGRCGAEGRRALPCRAVCS